MSEWLGKSPRQVRGWSAALAASVFLAFQRLLLVAVLRLEFHVRVRVVRTMYIPRGSAWY